jgi:type IV secretory pathway VirB4 component
MRVLDGVIRRGRSAPMANVLGPDSIEVHPDALRIGNGWVRTFAITGYPREVRAGWLEPLLTQVGRADVTLHVEPVPALVAADQLRRQRARLESTRRIDAARGRLADPAIDVAAADAADLAERVARGQGRLFRVGLYVTVRSGSKQSLDAESQRLRALACSLLLDAHPASFRSLQGWITTLPLGLDGLRMRRVFDTDALAASFPFSSAELSSSAGVLYGRTLRGSGLVRWDRFAQPNHNAVILARSGAGKSYLAKLEALRSLYRGVEVSVIDPENEYRRLAEAVGGAYLHLGRPRVRLNPFDLGPGGGDALIRQALFIHTLVAVLVGGPLEPAARAALDRAVVAAYAAAGINSDPRTHCRPAPLLVDLARELGTQNSDTAVTLAGQLAPFVTGTHRDLFDGPTTTAPDGHLVVFSTRDLPDELKAAGMLLTLAAVWRRVTDPSVHRQRLVVVDEAWLLMRDTSGAAFLHRLAKSARKHWCGLTVVTQDAADLLNTDLGQAVVANAATQVLMRQAPQAIDALGHAFRLSEGERAFLLAARPGEAILAAGSDRVAFRVVASAAEHRLVTSDPAELVDGDDADGDDA